MFRPVILIIPFFKAFFRKTRQHLLDIIAKLDIWWGMIGWVPSMASDVQRICCLALATKKDIPWFLMVLFICFTLFPHVPPHLWALALATWLVSQHIMMSTYHSKNLLWMVQKSCTTLVEPPNNRKQDFRPHAIGPPGLGLAILDRNLSPTRCGQVRTDHPWWGLGVLSQIFSNQILVNLG